MKTVPEIRSDVLFVRKACEMGGGFIWMQIHGFAIDARNRVLLSSFFQLILIMAVRRGEFSKRERLHCWALLRKARKGADLGKLEAAMGEDGWDELLQFVAHGLLRLGKRRVAYVRNGMAIWHSELRVLAT